MGNSGSSRMSRAESAIRSKAGGREMRVRFNERIEQDGDVVIRYKLISRSGRPYGGISTRHSPRDGGFCQLPYEVETVVYDKRHIRRIEDLGSAVRGFLEGGYYKGWDQECFA
ncbi:hypothetical protein ACFLQN_03150 [Candidatus Aenigmatarchaeota archaeon]